MAVRRDVKQDLFVVLDLVVIERRDAEAVARLPAGTVTLQGPAAKSTPLRAPPRSSVSTMTVTSSERGCDSTSSGLKASPSVTR